MSAPSGKKPPVAVVILLVGSLIAVAVWRWIASRSESIYAGTIEATRVDLSSRVASVVSSYEAKEGQTVGQDDVIVKLACEDLKLAAEAAGRDFSRADRLVKTGSIPQETYEHLRMKRDDASLKASWCVVKAPLAGTLLDVYREKGEWVSPGTRLLTIADLSEVWVTVYVAQPLLPKLSLGMPVQGLIADLGNRRFDGKITKISDEAEFTPKNVQTRSERTRLIHAVKVTFANPDRVLKPGMSIEVSLPE